jgi:predicted nucleotidyltransferase
MAQDDLTQAKVEEAVQRIAAHFRPEKIVIFGSHARGDQRPDSDLDLLVVMEVPGSKRKQAAAIEMSLVGIDLPTDVIVATPDEVERLRRVPGSIFKPAFDEGRVAYERPI